MHLYLMSLLFLLLPLCFTARPAEANWKRAQILSMAKQYCPAAYQLLTAEPGYAIEQFSHARKKQNLAIDFATVVHETCHRRNYMIGVREKEEGYYIAPGVEIGVKKGGVYNSHVLNDFVADSLQQLIFRYPTYIGMKSNYLGSQLNGIYGLMNEYSAYYQGTLASFHLYGYYLNEVALGYEDAESWLNYISNVAGNITAYYEFKLFISWYLQYARLHHPDVYQDCMENSNLRIAYTLIERQYKQLIFQYYNMRQRLIKKLEAGGHSISFVDEPEMGIVLEAFDSHGNMQGVGIHEEDMQMIRSLLKQPEHQVLEAFSMPTVSIKNYRSFLED